jgi:hypothetical protein
VKVEYQRKNTLTKEVKTHRGLVLDQDPGRVTRRLNEDKGNRGRPLGGGEA